MRVNARKVASRANGAGKPACAAKGRNRARGRQPEPCYKRQRAKNHNRAAACGKNAAVINQNGSSVEPCVQRAWRIQAGDQQAPYGGRLRKPARHKREPELGAGLNCLHKEGKQRTVWRSAQNCATWEPGIGMFGMQVMEAEARKEQSGKFARNRPKRER